MTAITNTPNFNAQYFNVLVSQLWNGEISQKTFEHEARNLGVTEARIGSIIDDLLEVDGLLEVR